MRRGVRRRGTYTRRLAGARELVHRGPTDGGGGGHVRSNYVCVGWRNSEISSPIAVNTPLLLGGQVFRVGEVLCNLAWLEVFPTSRLHLGHCGHGWKCSPPPASTSGTVANRYSVEWRWKGPGSAPCRNYRLFSSASIILYPLVTQFTPIIVR